LRDRSVCCMSNYRITNYYSYKNSTIWC